MISTLLSVAALAVGSAGQAAAVPSTSCLTCHADPELFDDEQRKKLETFRADVHAEVGLSCHDCHGGNPAMDMATDNAGAMNPDFASNPYTGRAERKDIPAFCGRCHSDPERMKRFRPDLRVDQEKEFATSHHGRGLAKGDENVATCIDCHGVHGIARAADPRSPVHPTRVAATCGRCHADAERMAGYEGPHGKPLPVDQLEQWNASVHAAAMVKGDLSAPTCNDCHGNHGATPPGIESLGRICGTCHGREAELYARSSKAAALQKKGVGQDTGCIACHGNHGLLRPTVAMLGPLPETPCAFCHEGAVPERDEAVRVRFEATRDALAAEAARKGLTGTARFDFLVDSALALPFHGDGAQALRPEFARLFAKFRIGRTVEGSAAVVRCESCHEGVSDAGGKSAAAMLASMRSLTDLTAKAERALLGARRGGVEVRPSLAFLDAAVDAQIGLEVLVHEFDAGEGSEFAKRHAAGIDAAQKALDAGTAALGELEYRRRGLAVSLVLVGLVLVGLWRQIRRHPA